MHTTLTTSPAEAARFIARGEVVAFPTETVYGLGAALFDDSALARIFEAKGRPADNPLIAHVATRADVDRLVQHVPPAARLLMERFFPGPLTLVFPKADAVPDLATGGLDTIGIRMPRHAVAQAFLRACATPLAAPSANRSGRPSPTTWEAVRTDLDGRIACILQGDRATLGLESTVADCTGEVPIVLRAGTTTLEALREVIPETFVAAPGSAEARRSPGTRYRHYAPGARVCLVGAPPSSVPERPSAYVGLEPPLHADVFRPLLVCTDVEAYARELFHFFRACDAAGAETIYCQRVEERGLGRALMDRLRRASA